MTAPQFTWSDAWLLLAVAVAAERGRATLKDVIAAGDAVNHAIFTPAELRRGFAKLIAAGHVSARQDGFDVSAGVRATLADTQAGHVATSILRKRLESLLNAAPYPAGHPRAEDPDWAFPELTDAMISAAVREYHKDFARAYRDWKGTP